MKRIYLSFFFFVIATFAVLQFALSPLIDTAVEHYFRNQLNSYYRDLVKGTFYLLEENVSKEPVRQWRRHAQRLQAHFGYPIDVAPNSEVEMTAEERDLLLKHQVVVQEQGERFILRIRQSDHSMIMGPIKDPNLNLYSLHIFVWGTVIAFLALFTLVWTLPFWHKLKKISTAALAFGDGQFDARAIVPPRSALASLASAFNGMADRIQQLINAQKELTNAVSHELRTPISRIRFSLEMLDTATKVSDRKHYSAEILKDVDDLDGLVTESLTYARFDSGAPKIDWQKRKVEPWSREIAMEALRGRPLIEFKCCNGLDRPDREVFLEPRYMGRALGNLIQNAANHARQRVELTLAENGKDCIMHIDDDGEGIADEDRQRVFQAFTRLDTSRSRASGGYGLGLAIVHRVLAWHGGTASVSTSPLGGARLTISWPGFSEDKPQPPPA